MRTETDIQEQIAKLKVKQAEIETNYQQHVAMQTNPHLKDQQAPLWEAAAILERWDQECRQIQDQLRVLYWVSGKFEHFPWR
jgi:hypothetical protein